MSSARLGVHDEVQPGQHRLPHLRRVVEGGAGEGGHEDVGDPLPDGLRVPLEGHEDEAAPVPAEAVAPGEEPHPLPLLEGVYPHGLSLIHI